MEKACVLRTARSNHVLEYQPGASVATKALFLSTVLRRLQSEAGMKKCTVRYIFK